MEILDESGPLTYAQIHDGMLSCKPNSHKYCRRAVDLGLALRDKTARPALFSAVPGWREAFAARRAPANAVHASTKVPRFGAHNPFGSCYFSDVGQADREAISGAN